MGTIFGISDLPVASPWGHSVKVTATKKTEPKYPQLNKITLSAEQREAIKQVLDKEPEPTQLEKTIRTSNGDSITIRTVQKFSKKEDTAKMFAEITKILRKK